MVDISSYASKMRRAPTKHTNLSLLCVNLFLLLSTKSTASPLKSPPKLSVVNPPGWNMPPGYAALNKKPPYVSMNSENVDCSDTTGFLGATQPDISYASAWLRHTSIPRRSWERQRGFAGIASMMWHVGMRRKQLIRFGRFVVERGWLCCGSKVCG